MTIILASNRDWFASALEGVLEAASFRIHRVRHLEELAATLASEAVDAVLLDAHLDGDTTVEDIRELLSGPLSPDVPLLVYISGLPDERRYCELLDAGAWDVLEGRIRPDYFVSRLRRFAQIGGRRGETDEAARNGAGVHPSVDDVLARLPVLEALARREEANIAVMAIGPTRPSGTGTGARLQSPVARACLEGLRKSDLWGWLDSNEDVAVVAYAAPHEGAEVLAKRLASMASDRLDVAGGGDALSVGVVELSPDDLPPEVRAEDRSRGEPDILSAARRALEEARAAGGGIRFAQ